MESLQDFLLLTCMCIAVIYACHKNTCHIRINFKKIFIINYFFLLIFIRSIPAEIVLKLKQFLLQGIYDFI